ncbi:MAG: DUF4340 domain-containing protein [Treponema sp.]|nr:DUF4340 domain-containing protein [Treponema sp.]MBQ5383321.1 DUF4340 domain-containing protein [Treponema sp.]
MNDTKERKRKKGLFIFLCADIFLLLVFIITMMPFTKKTSAPSVKSAVLNVNKIPEIASITFSENDEDGEMQKVTLEKNGGFWVGTDSSTGKKWPADNQNVATLLDKCSQIVNVYTAASTKDAWESFGLGEESAFKLGFYDGSGKIITEIFFGKSDYLTSRAAFRVHGKETVFQTDISIKSYLSASASFWADPFVYPQALTGYTRMKSESLLRHGALVDFNAAGKQPDYTFRKDFENGSSARFLIYKSDMQSESLYNIVPFFIAGPSADADEKKAVESFNYAYTMSQWTLEKFSEEVVQQ